MDVLSDVLRVMRLSGAMFLEARFTAPWCVLSQVTAEECQAYMADPGRVVAYHYVVEGRMLVRRGEEAPIEVSAGQIVLLSRNDPHCLGSTFDIPAADAAQIAMEPVGGGMVALTHGGGGDLTRIVCGFLGFDAAANPVTASLPPVLVMDVARGAAGSWIESSFHYAAREAAAGRAGSGTVLSRLSELLFIEVLRRWLAEAPEDARGWLAGLRDPVVGSALGLLHANLAHPWTAEELARQTGVCRSVFAERFTHLVGEPPMRYLAGWRMRVAAHMLREERHSVGRTAFAVGYESEAAFSRAFKREYGVAPAGWRREFGKAA